MNKTMFKLICATFVVCILILIFTASHYNSVKTNAKNNIDSYTVNKDNLKNAKASEKSNRILINQVKKDPDKLARDAEESANKVIEVLQHEENKSDYDKEKIYKNKLANYMTDDVLDNSDLSSIQIPSKHNIEVSTSRGHVISVLVSGEKSRYLKLDYNTSEHKIDAIKEYKLQN